MHNASFTTGLVQRARKVWWTVHLLDRQITSLQGVPLGLRDDDITAEVPAYKEMTRVRALQIHIQLVRVYATILNGTRSDPSLRRNCSARYRGSRTPSAGRG